MRTCGYASIHLVYLHIPYSFLDLSLRSDYAAYLQVLVCDLLCRGLFDDAVIAHHVPLDVGALCQRFRGFGRRGNGILLDVDQRA